MNYPISHNLSEKQANEKHKAIIITPIGNHHPLMILNCTPKEADNVYNEWFNVSPEKVQLFKERWVVDVGVNQ